MGASNFTSFGSQLYGTSALGAQGPQGEGIVLEDKEEQEKKTKKTEEKRECSLDIKVLEKEKLRLSKTVREISHVYKKDTDSRTCTRRQMLWCWHRTYHNESGVSECIWI